MKTITKQFNVYSLEELKAVDTEAYEEAMNNVREDYTETQIDFFYQDMEETMQEFAKVFNISIRDYSFGIYHNSYVNVDTDDYMDLDNEEKNKLVKEANNLKNEDCPFTGIHTDLYITDYFKENEVSYNDLHKHLDDVLHVAVSNFMNDLENDLEDDTNILEFAINEEFEFLVDGTIYKAD
ncbi:hypothetical protein [Staphylococcus virus vB_SurM-PSU5]|nr:hypothetical protein [Staphylococcus virus vB_SurM-PSU5]